jgi:hypothetical protein
MVLIAADNRDVERSLQKLVTLTEKAGAVFSDDIVVRCADGNLSIEAPPDSTGKVLMGLPWDCLVPLPPFRLGVVDDNIVMSSHKPALTPACVARMEACLELYNLTNKLAAHRRTSPWPLVASHPDVLEYVTRGRGRGGYVISEKLNMPANENELLLQSFWYSRVFDYKVTGQDLPTPAPNFHVLLPVLDAMNHHFHGAPFRYVKLENDPCIVVTRSFPIPGTGNECFAYYGQHDSFDTWLTYGFIDESVPFVCSVPMTINLPNLGTIQVANFIKTRADGELPESEKDLYFYIPKLLARRGTHIQVASLLIPGPGAPRALRRTLRFLITEMRPGHPKQNDLAIQAEEQVVTVTRTYYENLMALLRSVSPTDPLQKPILDNFIRLCNLQLARIQNYIGYPKD